MHNDSFVDQGFPARPGRNHLTIFSPQGQVVYDYVKNKPVAGLEPAMAAQLPPVVFRAGRVAYAGAICADFDYPGLIPQMGTADIVFAPAADWPGIRDLHARMGGRTIEGTESNGRERRSAGLGPPQFVAVKPSQNTTIFSDFGTVANLVGPLTVTGTLTVRGGGTLLTNCQPVTGAGSFVMEPGARLSICDPAGISVSGPTGPFN